MPIPFTRISWEWCALCRVHAAAILDHPGRTHSPSRPREFTPGRRTARSFFFCHRPGARGSDTSLKSRIAQDSPGFGCACSSQDSSRFEARYLLHIPRLMSAYTQRFPGLAFGSSRCRQEYRIPSAARSCPVSSPFTSMKWTWPASPSAAFTRIAKDYRERALCLFTGHDPRWRSANRPAAGLGRAGREASCSASTASRCRHNAWRPSLRLPNWSRLQCSWPRVLLSPSTAVLPFLPFVPFSPFSPCGPFSPLLPAGPWDPAGPVAPAGPMAPAGPVAPVAPLGPAGPREPAFAFDLLFATPATGEPPPEPGPAPPERRPGR